MKRTTRTNKHKRIGHCAKRRKHIAGVGCICTMPVRKRPYSQPDSRITSKPVSKRKQAPKRVKPVAKPVVKDKALEEFVKRFKVAHGYKVKGYTLNSLITGIA